MFSRVSHLATTLRTKPGPARPPQPAAVPSLFRPMSSFVDGGWPKATLLFDRRLRPAFNSCSSFNAQLPPQ